MENLDTQERLMQRDIANIQIKIDKIYKETVKKRDLKEELDNKTTVTQNELSMDLKVSHATKLTIIIIFKLRRFLGYGSRMYKT